MSSITPDETVVGQDDNERNDAIRPINDYGSLEIENLFNDPPACWLPCIMQLLFRIPQLELVMLYFTSMEFLDITLQFNKENLMHIELLFIICGTFREMRDSTTRSINISSLLKVLEKLSPYQIRGNQHDICEMMSNIAQWLKIAIEASMAYQMNHVNNRCEDENRQVENREVEKFRELYLDQMEIFNRIFTSLSYNDSLGLTVDAQVGNFRDSVERFFVNANRIQWM